MKVSSMIDVKVRILINCGRSVRMTHIRYESPVIVNRFSSVQFLLTYDVDRSIGMDERCRIVATWKCIVFERFPRSVQ